MTLTEVVLVISVAFNITTMFVVLSMYRDMGLMKMLIGQIHGALGNVAGKVHTQEAYLQKLGNAFSDFTNLMESVAEKIDMAANIRQGSVYRTMDGKYAASSLQDLIEKIRKDGVENEYLSEEELEGLRQLFSDDDDDDSDENEFNPDKGKF